MKSEYVKLSGSERVYGEKNLLQSQLEFLDSIRAFKNYKRLRSEEFRLKVGLKSKIGETLAALERIEDLLPKTE